jgi:transcriptional regulator with XRE-family HTH domain
VDDKVQTDLIGNIRRLMDEQGFTQVTLSRATGNYVSQSTISKIMRGHPTSSDVIGALARAFNVEPWRLLVDPLSDVARLCDALTNADPAGRQFIQQVVERELSRSQKV